MYQRVMTIFSSLMTFFYLGIGFYFLVSDTFGYIDKPIRVIFGVSFMVYGLYRAYVSFIKIRDSFFSESDEEE